MSEETRKLSDLIDGIEMCMFTTQGEDGRLFSRPMATQKAQSDGSLWFITKKGSPKHRELENNSRVNLAYSGKHAYVSVSGVATLVEDRAKLDELWSVAYRAWFPKGKEDPDIVLVKVQVESAEYWESHSPAIVHVIGLAKAILTGKQYSGGENGLIDFTVH